MRTCFHRGADLETCVRCVHVLLPLVVALGIPGECFRCRDAFGLASNRESTQQCSVQTHIELVWLTHADQVVIQLATEDDLE